MRVDRCDVWSPSLGRPVDLEAVEEHLRELSASYNAEVLCDPWQAELMLQRMRRRDMRVRAVTFTQRTWSDLALRLYTMLRDRRIGLLNDAALIDELAAVRLVERHPGYVKLDHDPGAHDDRAVALALALSGLESAVREPVRIFSSARSYIA